MGTVTSIVHAFGGRWFDMNWHATLDTPEWQALDRLLQRVAQEATGRRERRRTDSTRISRSSPPGHCAIWIDSTVAATLLFSGEDSQVAGNVSYAPMPIGSGSQCANVAVELESRRACRVETPRGRDEVCSVGNLEGVHRVGGKDAGLDCRAAGNAAVDLRLVEYQRVAPFASFVHDAIGDAIPADSGEISRPYRSAQFVAIPEYQGLGTQVGQIIAATLTGQSDVETALKEAQSVAERAIQQAGASP